MARCPSSVRPQSKIGTLINTKHRRIARAIQEYDTIGPYLNSNPPKSGASVNLSYSFFLFFFHFNLFQVFFGCLHIPKMRCIVELTKT